ncbi:general vesicular transport factor p115-like [Rhopilema esculentum]|uniref:general vesicular transport factor p115-like n=1 Tax=Rhopilema esculentum TaxID=499914 RepID=UPI0031D22971
MDFLRAGLKSVVGSQENTDSQSQGIETIDRLCDRVGSATLLDDRRGAVRALKSLSKKFKLDVGTRSMDILVNVLHQDRADQEITGLALETLVSIMSPDASVTDPEKQKVDNELSKQFSEIFLKKQENISSLLELLEEYDFRVRWPTVKLLTVLLRNQGNQIQQAILVSPLGVSRLMDLLADNREVIRNDGLLLLIQLTKGNAAIQKIVAFENAFDRLFEVISDEGFSDGGVVTEDCLILMHNLIKSNVSNQNFFREGSYIQKLIHFFDFGEPSEDRVWSEPKVNNVLLMLQLIRLLVSPSNPVQATSSSQKVMQSCGLLKILCGVLVSSGIPAEILTENVNTVAEVIRGNQANQEFFAEVTADVGAPGSAARSAIVVLLMSMVNEKQPFSLRCAVLYCFQCYLYKNQVGQSQIVATLLPSSAEANVITAGQLLCAGLFSTDPFSNWSAATALAHAMKGGKDLKEQLLRVQLATGIGSAPVSLLQQCTNILSQSGISVQTRAGLISLLCTWLHNCPLAVSHFLQSPSNIPFLISCVESHSDDDFSVVEGLSALLIGVLIVYNDNSVEIFTKDNIKRTVTTRIDLEHFMAKISNVSKTEEFTSAVKSTQIQVAAPQLLFDNEFTKLFKKLEASITKALQADQDEDTAAIEEQRKAKLSEEHDSIIESYKALIRDQDKELRSLKTKSTEIQEEYNKAERQLQQQAVELTQLRAQIELSKGVSEETGESETQASLLQAQLNPLKQELQNKDTKIAELESELESVKGEMLRVRGDSTVDEFMALEANANVQTFQQLNNQTMIELDQMRRQMQSLQDENSKLNEQLNQQKESKLEENGVNNESEGESKSKEDYDQLKADYEDLLVLLEDQDAKIENYKMKLKVLGEKVEDDEEEEEDDNEEELEGLNGNTNENEAAKATSDSNTENVEEKIERPESPRAELELKEEIDVD